MVFLGNVVKVLLIGVKMVKGLLFCKVLIKFVVFMVVINVVNCLLFMVMLMILVGFRRVVGFMLFGSSIVLMV